MKQSDNQARAELEAMLREHQEWHRQNSKHEAKLKRRVLERIRKCKDRK